MSGKLVLPGQGVFCARCKGYICPGNYYYITDKGKKICNLCQTKMNDQGPKRSIINYKGFEL